MLRPGRPTGYGGAPYPSARGSRDVVRAGGAARRGGRRRLTPGSARRGTRRWPGDRGRGARPCAGRPRRHRGRTRHHRGADAAQGRQGQARLPQDRRRSRRAPPRPGRAHEARPASGPCSPARHRRDGAAHRHAPDGCPVAGPGGVPRPPRRPRLAVRRRTSLPGCLPGPGHADHPRRRGHRAGASQGRAWPGDRAAPVLHGHDRRQRRQHPVQRAPLADRPAGREADPAGLRRPDQVRRCRGPDRLRRPLLAPRRPAHRPARGPADQPVRLPAGPGAARRLSAAVRHPRPRHAVAVGLRQPRRAGPGQRPLEPADRPDRDGIDEDHRPATRA